MELTEKSKPRIWEKTRIIVASEIWWGSSQNDLLVSVFTLLFVVGLGWVGWGGVGFGFFCVSDAIWCM